MGRPDFGRSATYPAPPVPHALHDDDDDAHVVDGDLAEALDDGLPVEPTIEPQPEPALPLGCRWRVPLTQVHNPSGVLLIRATVGMRNQQNLYPKAPTIVAKLLQYSGLGSNTGMGFLCTNDLLLSSKMVNSIWI